MVKAIFFDIDGTLVSFQTHKISPTTLEALHQLRRRGIKLFIASGRHKRMLTYPLSAFPFDGCVSLSGQYCFCGDKVLYRSPMSREAVEEMVSLAMRGAFSCLFLEEEDSYLNFVDDYTREFSRNLNVPVPPVADPRRALGREIYQGAAFLSPEYEHLLLDHAPHLTATRWHPHFMDVIPLDGGKDRGMDAVLDHFHIPLEECMAFGDGENDLSMLVHAGVGVAMGSASDAVKAKADYVTGSVDQEGVPAALAHFGLL